jgi:hypothetical protein
MPCCGRLRNKEDSLSSDWRLKEQLHRAPRPTILSGLQSTSMQSKLAQEVRLAAIAAAQLLPPDERRNAFLEHCQLMMELHEAGKNLRNNPAICAQS